MPVVRALLAAASPVIAGELKAKHASREAAASANAVLEKKEEVIQPA